MLMVTQQDNAKRIFYTLLFMFMIMTIIKQFHYLKLSFFIIFNGISHLVCFYAAPSQNSEFIHLPLPHSLTFRPLCLPAFLSHHITSTSQLQVKLNCNNFKVFKFMNLNIFQPLHLHLWNVRLSGLSHLPIRAESEPRTRIYRHRNCYLYSSDSELITLKLIFRLFQMMALTLWLWLMME